MCLRRKSIPIHDTTIFNLLHSVYVQTKMLALCGASDVPLETLCDISCEFCAQPLKFEAFSCRERAPPCNGNKCQDVLLQAAV